jgi:hypothetical protein
MKSRFPKRVAVGVGVALVAVVLGAVASKRPPPPSPPRLTFVGFENRQEGKVAAFAITNTEGKEILIEGFERAPSVGTNSYSLGHRRATVWFEEENWTMATYRIKPGSRRKIFLRVDPSNPSWRLGMVLRHRLPLWETARRQILWSWTTRNYRLRLECWAQSETCYSEPIVN